MNIQKNSILSPVVQITHHTACKVVDVIFAQQVADEICKATQTFQHTSAVIGGYTPPQDGMTTSDFRARGYLELSLLSDRHEVAIGVFFGAHASPGDPIIRTKFDAKMWAKDPANPLAGNLEVANMDEAWLIICKICAQLEIHAISISYGA